MRKINVRAVFASALIACFCAAYAQASDTGLIRVVPGYHEAVSAPHVKTARTYSENTRRAYPQRSNVCVLVGWKSPQLSCRQGRDVRSEHIETRTEETTARFYRNLDAQSF